MNARGPDDRQQRLERAAELRAAGHSPSHDSQIRDGQSRGGPSRDGQLNEERLDEERLDEELRQKRLKFDYARRADYLIRDAMARGEFDHLQYAGKPIPGLGGTYDPDWWIKGLIQREHLTGLGPKALLLRVEDAELDARLDALPSERLVRDAVADFNARVIDARRQLEGGPP
uniref:DnaJ family domain-containing protein n=1 Tax=Sinomonas sp. G460-2 TaxID=3393464 RepID=UPI0039F035FD